MKNRTWFRGVFIPHLMKDTAEKDYLEKSSITMQMEEKWEKADLTSWVVIVIMIRMVIKQVRADPESLEE